MKALKELGMDTVIAQSRGLASADMDGEEVMMDIEKGKYYALNSVGSRIWKLIDKPQTVGKVISTLQEEYEVEAETCCSNVLIFISKLHEEGLICVNK